MALIDSQNPAVPDVDGTSPVLDSHLSTQYQSDESSTLAARLPAVSVRGLVKRYGKTSVLNGVDFEVHAGEICGFLGRNGVGKSTAIRILMGIQKADAGEIQILGKPLKGNVLELRQRIGYVAQEQNFYPWMTSASLGKFAAGLYRNWNQSRYDELIEQFQLPPKMKVETFSGGMKAKIALALALGAEPELLLLDEPTAGMDPVVRREFLQIVNGRTRDRGMTTFFSSHLISDVEAIADRICILDDGKMIYDDALEDLSNSLTTISCSAEAANLLILQQAFDDLPRVVYDQTVSQQRQLVLQLDPRSDLLDRLPPIWKVVPMTLEDVFVSMVSANESPGIRL